MTINFKGGRLPADPTKPRLRLSSLLTAAAPTYPENIDWLTKVTNYPMYKNDTLGDCTCATIGHMIQNLSTYGQGKTISITDQDVVNAYSAVSGYDQRTGANDNGAVVQDVLNYWRKTGVAGHKILAFAEVDLNNQAELYAGANTFGDLYLGINFPNTAMDQFNRGQAWDVVAGAYSEGGHAINTAWYDVSEKMWKVVTWGRVQPMTQAFFDKYVEEAWVVISPEWFDAKGSSPVGLDMYALGQQFESLTGEPNPFPAPQPVPEPTPTPAPPAPTPAPVEPPAPVDDADEKLLAAAEQWLGRRPWFYKPFQRSLREWIAAKQG